MTSYRPGTEPSTNEIRVEERDGRRWLQQYRLKPGGYLYEYVWVDVAELGPTPTNVTPMRGPTPVKR